MAKVIDIVKANVINPETGEESQKLRVIYDNNRSYTLLADEAEVMALGSVAAVAAKVELVDGEYGRYARLRKNDNSGQMNKKTEPMNSATREVTKQMIREKLISDAQVTYRNNPLADTPFEGLSLRSAIISSSESYKKAFCEQKELIGLTETEINQLVDEVIREVLQEIIK